MLWLKKYDISFLKSDVVLQMTSLPKLRRMADILVIDDDEFIYKSALNKQGFNIEQKYDISSIKDVEPYNIILCDTKGVGKEFESQYEGAFLVKEIKNNYPDKTVISYSAHEYSMDYQKFLDYADDYMPKGSAIEDWVSKLDKVLRDQVNPIVQWKKMRDQLFNADVSICEVANLEAKYVKAIKNKNFTSFAKLQNSTNECIAAIAKIILTSIIKKILTGGVA